MAIERVPFADTGVEVSNVCLGTMMFGGRTDQAEAVRIMHRALDEGIDFWDTAATYCDSLTESIVGEGLAGRRERVFLATKVNKLVSFEKMAEGFEGSLRRLKTDHVDLLQIHWPSRGMSLEVVTREMDKLVRAGKVRFLGCSNFPGWVLSAARALAERTGRARMVSFQPPYNLLERGVEVELLPMCLHQKIAVIPYRPLVAGLLAGKYRPGEPLPADSRGRTDERIGRMLQKYAQAISGLWAFAEERGTTPAAVSLAWVRCHPAVTAPIVGISRVDQIDRLVENVAFDLTGEDRGRLAELFGTEVKEESLGAFPDWRRDPDILGEDG